MVQRFGLAWNPNKKGHILGASEDKTVCHWQGYLCCTPFSRVLTISRLRDLNAYSKANSTIEPLTVFKDHTAVVGVRFASQMPSYMKLMPPDTKDVDWHASNENVFVSVGDDKMLKMCAFKRLGKPLHTFEAHTDEVFHLAWSPHSAAIFASASSDRRINVWDLSQTGVEQTPDDQEDGPPELMFIHGGSSLMCICTD